MRKTSFLLAAVTVGISAVGSLAQARKSPSEDEQRRSLLAKLAAASAEKAPEERSDADLMYDAMKQWHGEPRGSAAVEQALVQSKKDLRLERKQLEEKVRKMFWKDPFTKEVVPVRKEDREVLFAHAERESRASENGDDEVSRLKAEVAAARAENARLRAALARAEQGKSASETLAVQEERPLSTRRFHAGSPSGGHSHRDGGELEAMNAPTHRHRAGSSKARSTQPEAPIAAPEAPAAENVTGPPPGWQSSDPRGIIIVPITASIRAR